MHENTHQLLACANLSVAIVALVVQLCAESQLLAEGQRRLQRLIHIRAIGLPRLRRSHEQALLAAFLQLVEQEVFVLEEDLVAAFSLADHIRANVEAILKIRGKGAQRRARAETFRLHQAAGVQGAVNIAQTAVCRACLPRLLNDLADRLRQRDRPRRDACLDFVSAHDPASDASVRVEGAGDRAGNALRHHRVMGIGAANVGDVAVVICHRQRARGAAVDVRQQRIQTWHSATSCVGIQRW